MRHVYFCSLGSILYNLFQVYTTTDNPIMYKYTTGCIAMIILISTIMNYMEKFNGTK